MPDELYYATKAAYEDGYETAQQSCCEMLAAVVANWPDKTDDAPGHCHNIKGRWDKDGSECQWCKTWREIRATVAANVKGHASPEHAPKIDQTASSASHVPTC